MSPRKFASKKIAPRKLPPGKLPPENCHPWNFFLISNFYFYGNFRLKVKHIFIQYILLVKNNSFFILYFSIILFLVRIFFIFSYGI